MSSDFEYSGDVEMVNGTLGCEECGGLLCVGRREGRHQHPVKTIEQMLAPHPAADIEIVQCASCGEIIWEVDSE